MVFARTGIAALLVLGSIAAASADPAAVADCDRLAGSQLDPQKVAPGVAFADIDAKRAVPACQEAVKLQPGVLRLQFELARAVDRSGDLATANTMYLALADQNNAMAADTLGYAYIAGSFGMPQDFDKAAKYLAIAAAGGVREASGALGALYDVGYGVPEDHAKASRLLAEAGAEAAAGLNAVAYNLSLAADRLGKAAELAEAAVKDTPDSSTSDKANYLDTLAWIYHRQGRDAEAAATSERSIQLEGADPVSHDHLGDIYAALGRRDEARGQWQKALDLPARVGFDDVDRAAIAEKLKQGA